MGIEWNLNRNSGWLIVLAKSGPRMVKEAPSIIRSKLSNIFSKGSEFDVPTHEVIWGKRGKYL